METIPTPILERLPSFETIRDQDNPTVQARFTQPTGLGSWVWYVLSRDESAGRDDALWCFVKGYESEFGTVCLSDLSAIGPIKWDESFQPAPLWSLVRKPQAPETIEIADSALKTIEVEHDDDDDTTVTLTSADEHSCTFTLSAGDLDRFIKLLQGARR